MNMILVFAVIMAQVIEHETKEPGIRDRLRLWLIVVDQGKIRRKLATPEVWALKTFSFRGPTDEHLLKFDHVVIFVGRNRHLKPSMDSVGHVTQE
jgi:hypothetical protein